VLWCLDAIGIVEGADGERASAGAAALSDLAPKATRGGGLGDLGIGMVGGSS
jgi:hypothetical protein